MRKVRWIVHVGGVGARDGSENKAWDEGCVCPPPRPWRGYMLLWAGKGNTRRAVNNRRHTASQLHGRHIGMHAAHRDGLCPQEQGLDAALVLQLPLHVSAGRVHGHGQEGEHLDWRAGGGGRPEFRVGRRVL